MIDPQYLGYLLIQEGFETWFLYLFKAIEQTKFIKENIHSSLFEYISKVYDGSITRLNINIPPRAGKTTLATYLLVYALTINPKSNIIYTSYSQSLLTDIAGRVKDILENPIYKAMYPGNTALTDEQLNPEDDFWAQYLKKETGKNTYTAKKIVTSKGGICLFSSIGSQITGYGCFSYDTLILTEDGFKQIGDIVESRYKGKIWSYNFETKRKELQPIYDYVKNKKSKYLKIILDNNEKIYCTPDHIFYLKDGQQVRADKLRIGFKIMSDSFNLRDRNIKFLGNIFSRIIFIKRKINLFLSKVFKIVIKFSSLFIPLIANVFSNFAPYATTFNITNRAIAQTIIFGYLLIWAFIFCNSNGNFFCDFVKFAIGIILIFHVFFSRAITKVFKSIVCRVRVKMSHLLGRFADKGKKNKSVNKQRPVPIIFTKINPHIPFIIRVLFHNLFSFSRVNFTRFRNIISVIFGYRKIINIVDCKHIAPSYCVTLWNNNNFYITKSQVLVHNCGTRNGKGFTGALIIDDANKPDDIYHPTLRNKVIRYFAGTLLSRLNNSDVPIINIQQRLHIEDLSGVLQSKYNFQTLKRPLIEPDGTCNLPSQYSLERIKELQIDNYVFQSQYQQEPIILGGAVIKRDWFKYYNSTLDYNYTRLIITADTAMKIKEHNDFSVLMASAVTPNNQLHILEMQKGKWEAPDLKRIAVQLFEKYKYNSKTGLSCSGLYVEDKASGTGLIQELQRAGIPVIPLKVDSDKLTRVQSVLNYIASGQVLLPNDETYGFNPELLSECEAFTRDDTHLHDDIVDTLVYAIQEGLVKNNVSLLDYFIS